MGEYVPPLVCFSLGSLGYLCEFEFDENKLDESLCIIKQLQNDQKCKIDVDERLRLKVSVPENPIREVYKGYASDWYKKKGDPTLIKGYHILNEVVIDKGPCPTSV